MLQSTLRLLRPLQRFASPIGGETLIHGTGQDEMLLRKLQRLEIPFEVLMSHPRFEDTHWYLLEMSRLGPPPPPIP